MDHNGLVIVAGNTNISEEVIGVVVGVVVRVER
jgi:hypothetical protein